MSHSTQFRYCIVPKCTNSTFKTPNKLFFYVPSDKILRRKWCSILKVSYLSSKSTLYICEDHFDLTEDLENHSDHKLQEGNVALREGVVPHKFQCQEPPPEEQMKRVKKKRRIEVNVRDWIVKHVESVNVNTENGKLSTNEYAHIQLKPSTSVNNQLESFEYVYKQSSESVCNQQKSLSSICIKQQPSLPLHNAQEPLSHVYIKQEPSSPVHIEQEPLISISIAPESLASMCNQQETLTSINVKQEPLSPTSIVQDPLTFACNKQKLSTSTNTESISVMSPCNNNEPLVSTCVKDEPSTSADIGNELPFGVKMESLISIEDEEDDEIGLMCQETVPRTLQNKDKGIQVSFRPKYPSKSTITTPFQKDIACSTFKPQLVDRATSP